MRQKDCDDLRSCYYLEQQRTSNIAFLGFLSDQHFRVLVYSPPFWFPIWNRYNTLQCEFQGLLVFDDFFYC